MCGFIGYGSLKAINSDWLRGGLGKLSHRGPDAEGKIISEDGFVHMAHRRLSILDLSPAGTQPMVDESRKFIISFNGEIYNYQSLRNELVQKGHSFLTNTDTEVLLKSYIEWGVQFFSKIDGMFAFVIYDANKKKLILVRDRAGEKPLLYIKTQNQIRFSSELTALLEDKSLVRNFDPLGLQCYLTMGYVPPGVSIMSGISKLEPGYYIEYDLVTSELNKTQYWTLPEFDENLKLSDNVIIDELEDLLIQSLRGQLHADVPVGVLLSGGLDSSLLAAMAVREVAKLKTYTISFPGEGKFDESLYANSIASYIQSEHATLPVDMGGIADIVLKICNGLDEPLADSSMIPMYLVSNLIRKECAVAISGEGADELFGGYGHYKRIINISLNSKLIPLGGLKKISSIAEKYLPIGFKGRNFLKWASLDYQKELPINPIFFDSLNKNKRNPLNKLFMDELAVDFYKKSIVNGIDVLQSTTRTDFKMYLPGDILAKVDKMSMLNSLEIRAPYLGHKVIEYAFKNVPSNMKCDQTRRKIILQLIAKKYLPANFNYTRKQGFSVPISRWIKKGGECRDLFYSTLLDKDSIYDQKFIRSLINGQEKGRSNGERIFSLVVLELWRKKYKLHL
jgi:asparagine synthase (glutamine-hydrolysing)